MKKKNTSVGEIEKIIKSNDPSKFVGVYESASFEFRERSYYSEHDHNVTKEKARLELLKDVSSVSNSGGGFIVIGLKPEIDPSNFNQEFVDSVTKLDKESIKLESWIDVLSNHLTPTFHAKYLKHGFLGEDDDVFWMEIPDAKKIGCYPFIINKDQWVTEDEALLKGKLFGVYFRDNAENKLLISSEKLQSQLADLLKDKGEVEDKDMLREINRKLDRFTSIQELQSEITFDLELEKKRILERIDKRLDQNSDYFYISAIPLVPQKLKKFWLKGEKSVYEVINNPPTFRRAGWDLNTSYTEYPEIVGDAWESTNGDRKITYVNKNGSVATAGTIQGFLDWAMNKDNKTDVQNINAFGLVEYIANYFNFLYSLAKIISVEGDLSFNISSGFVIREDQKYRLTFAISETGEPIFLSESSLEMSVDQWDLGKIDPKIDELKETAGELVSNVYASFRYSSRYSHNKLPYLIEKDGSLVINEKAFNKN